LILCIFHFLKDMQVCLEILTIPTHLYPLKMVLCWYRHLFLIVESTNCYLKAAFCMHRHICKMAIKIAVEIHYVIKVIKIYFVPDSIFLLFIYVPQPFSYGI
jgi:hypothetical protein